MFEEQSVLSSLRALAIACAALCVAPAQSGAATGTDFGWFAPARRDVEVGDGARDVVALQVNSDAWLDAAVISFNLFGPSSVSILCGDGGGGFEELERLSVPPGAATLAAGDLDEDGHDDLIVPGFFDGTLALFLGDGAGGFVSQVMTVGDPAPFHAAVADFNQDGHQDVALTGTELGTLTIWAGDGAGGLTEVQALAAGLVPQHVAAFDVSGDGWVDAMVTDSEGDALLYFENDGAGNLVERQVLSSGETPVWVDVARRALGAPAYAAVALRGAGAVRLYRWDGTWTEDALLPAGTNPQSVELEFDLGAAPRVFIADQSSSELIVYPDPSASPQRYVTPNQPTAVHLADWNGDNRRDPALPCFGAAAAALFLADGADGYQVAPAFGPVEGAMSALTAIDLNADSHVDAVFLRQVAGRVSVAYGDGSGSLGPPVDIGPQTPAFPTGMAVLDYDGDQVPDFAVGQGTASNLWLYGSAAGYAIETIVSPGAGHTDVVASDLDADGRTDLAATLFLSNLVAVHFQDAAGFASPVAVPVGQGPSQVLPIDWDDDGLQDLVGLNVTDASLSVVRQSAPRAFDAPVTLPLGVTNPNDVVSLRLDGDGFVDLAVTGNDGLVLLMGDGAGGFAIEETFWVGGALEEAAVADVTGDGLEDVIAADRAASAVAVFAGLVGGGLARPRSFGSQSRPIDVELGDWNEDGRTDALTITRGDDRLSLLLGSVGGLTLGVQPGLSPAPVPRLVAAPNPFYRSVELRVDPAWVGQSAVLKIYDASGRRVATPFTGRLGQVVRWDGRAAGGRLAPRGLYWYRLDAGSGRVVTGKLTRR